MGTKKSYKDFGNMAKNFSSNFKKATDFKKKNKKALEDVMKEAGGY